MRRRAPLSLLVVSLLVALVAWLASSPADGAVLGRISYARFTVLAACAWCAVLALGVLAATHARLRGVALRATAAWLSLGAALLVLEAIAWLVPARHPMDNPWYLATGEGAVAARRLPFSRPPGLRWTGRSRGDLALLNDDADPYASEVTYATDRDGFRNSAAEETATVVFVGDSFTEAGNVAEDETFVRRVGERLGITVRNLGRAGYTAQSERIVLEDHALPAAPRVLVWQVAESNDLDEALHFARWVERGRPAFEDVPESRPSRREAWRQRSPTHLLFDRLRTPKVWSLEGTFRTSDGRDHAVRFLDVPSAHHMPRLHAGWPLLVESYREGVALARSARVEVMFLLVPIKLRVLGDVVTLTPRALRDLPPDWSIPHHESVAAHLEALCAELGVGFVDATGALRAAASHGRLVYPPNDTHLSAEGHAVVADVLAGAIAKLAATGALSAQP